MYQNQYTLTFVLIVLELLVLYMALHFMSVFISKTYKTFEYKKDIGVQVEMKAPNLGADASVHVHILQHKIFMHYTNQFL